MNAPRSETERESGGGDVTMLETILSDFAHGGIGGSMISLNINIEK